MAGPWEEYGGVGPTAKERQTEASIGSSQASAASSAASAEKTRRLLPIQERKERALATKAELDAQKLELALEKARRQTSNRPEPQNLEEARAQVRAELNSAIEAKRLSREMFGASGFGQSFTANISGTPAASVEALLKPIQANAAFNAIKKMRQESPTGAALGAVSDKELQLLYSSEAPLDPSASDEVFQSGLDTIIGNRIEMLSKLGEDPYKLAQSIPAEDLPQYADRFKAYRFTPEDTAKLSQYANKARAAGTFDPTDFAALMSEAYYNATGRQPDENFIRSAAQTGVTLANEPKADFKDFDYTPADTEVRKNIIGTGGASEKERTLGQALGEGAINFVPSVFELAYDTVKAFTVDLPDTIEGIANIVGGATGLSDDPSAYEAVKDYYRDRYGSAAGFKKALATDPASILADIAGIATGGATLVAKGLSTAGKVSKIASLSNAARTAETFGQFAAKADPLVIAGKTIDLGAGLGKKAAGTALVDIPAKVAGVTGDDVRQAFSAGKRGSEAFKQQLTGTGDIMDPIAKAEAGLTELYQARSADYQRRMAKMNKTEALDFADVEKALEGVRKVGRHKGIDISGAAGVWDEIDAKYMEFLDKGLNSIEDFDAMKRAIKEIGSRYPLGTPEYKVANQVSKAINQTIVDKAPVYANIMKDYRLASDTLSDIKSSIGIDAKSADTTLGKLQRAAAGKGPRGRTVLDILEQTPSGRGLGDMLAGQNLRGTEAQGFAPSMATPAALASGDVSPLGALLVTPRGLGEKAYSLGEKYGLAERGMQAVRGTEPVQRAEELFGKYAQPAAAAVRAVNPLIQAQVDPFQAPQITPESVLAEMRARYGVSAPQLMTRDTSRPSLADMASQYEQQPQVSLDTIEVPTAAPTPEEEEEEEGVPQFAKGGWVGPARSVAKGATFAFNDELEGLARMVMSGQLSREAYQREVNRIRALQQAYEDANPLQSMGYEMAGAFLPALIPGGQGASAGRLAALAAKYPRAATLGKVGAESALYGAGSANSMRDIPRAMGEEAAFGFGMYGAGEAGKKAYQKFKVRNRK